MWAFRHFIGYARSFKPRIRNGLVFIKFKAKIVFHSYITKCQESASLIFFLCFAFFSFSVLFISVNQLSFNYLFPPKWQNWVIPNSRQQIKQLLCKPEKEKPLNPRCFQQNKISIQGCTWLDSVPLSVKRKIRMFIYSFLWPTEKGSLSNLAYFSFKLVLIPKLILIANYGLWVNSNVKWYDKMFISFIAIKYRDNIFYWICIS